MGDPLNGLQDMNRPAAWEASEVTLQLTLTRPESGLVCGLGLETSLEPRPMEIHLPYLHEFKTSYKHTPTQHSEICSICPKHLRKKTRKYVQTIKTENYS